LLQFFSERNRRKKAAARSDSLSGFGYVRRISRQP